MIDVSVLVILLVIIVPYGYILTRIVSAAYFRAKLVYNMELSKFFMEERISENEEG
jgi:hypothetical protein